MARWMAGEAEYQVGWKSSKQPKKFFGEKPGMLT